MYFIAERGPAGYYQVIVDSPGEFRAPFETGSYTCLLWDTRGDASIEERLQLGRTLIESGCVYVVCGGATCGAWHDIIDEALITLQSEGLVPEERVVMTTWHEGEGSDDVAEFFVLVAVPAVGAVTQHLVLQIGQGWDKQNDLWTMVRGNVLYGFDPPDDAS